MSRLEDVRSYWSKRAEGYSENVAESLDSGRAEHWMNIIREHLRGTD